MLERPDQKDIADEASEDIRHHSQTKSFQEDEEERASITAALPHVSDSASVAAAAETKDEADKEEADEVGNSELDPHNSSVRLYRLLSTHDDSHVVDLPPETTVGDYVVQTSTYYRTHNLIDLNNDLELQNAAMNFSQQSQAKQDQLMEYYEALIRLSKKNHEPLSRQMTYLPPNSGDDTKLKTPYDALPEEKQKHLLQYYIDQYKWEYGTIVVHGCLGYAGEFFYLYWDMQARMAMYRKFLPNAPEVSNQVINYTATLPITLANVTYWPVSDARGYMLNRMLHQRSFSNAIRQNKLKTLMFLLYAFGGGYVEIVDINDDLDVLTAFGKIPVETLLIYAAIAYYTAFQFADVIEKSKKYAAMPSLVKRAFDRGNGRSFEDRVTDLFNGTHEAICVIERIFRMEYGGFEAGKQQSGQALAYILGGVVGIGTIPVAYALRTVPLRDMYDLDRYTDDQVREATARYDAKYAQSFIKGELKLFLTPSILLLVPGAVWATSYATAAVDDMAAKIAVGTAVATGSLVAQHLGFFLRYPARRRAIVDEIQHAVQPAPGSVVPNKLAYFISGGVNLLDQTSRTFSFGFMMSEMFPDLFDIETVVGSNLMLTVLFLDAFIAISAWLYQMDKSAEAYKGYSNKYFGRKLPRTEATTSLLDSRSSTPTANPFDTETPGGDEEKQEEKHHDTAPLIAANDVRSDSPSLFSRCAIM
jgi:hypothetical protein